MTTTARDGPDASSQCVAPGTLADAIDGPWGHIDVGRGDGRRAGVRLIKLARGDTDVSSLRAVSNAAGTDQDEGGGGVEGVYLRCGAGRRATDHRAPPMV